MPTLTQAQIQMYAQAAGLTPADKWAAIAMAESSGRTDVVNSIGCVGLWQINQPAHIKEHPSWTVKYLQDPANNARAAKTVYDKEGFSAWEAYTGPDGVGSDGPWKQYYKGNSSSTATNAGVQWYDPFGILPDGMGGAVENAVPGVAELGKMADAVVHGAVWISTPYNWVRIGYVMAGGILFIAGVGFIINSTLLGKVSSNPIVQGATSVIPGGSIAKGIGKSIGTKAKSKIVKPKTKESKGGTGSSAKRSGSSSGGDGNSSDDSSG